MSKYPARLLTPSEIDDCLVVLARFGGNSSRAHSVLKERLGDKTPAASTLRQWRGSAHAERYLELAASLSTEDKDRAIVQGFRDALGETQEIASALREKLSDNLDAIEPKDIPKSLQSLAIVQGVTTEKTLLLEGRPTMITETRSPEWYEGKLAELITDADVIEDESSG